LGQITSLFVHKVLAQADPVVDRRSLLVQVGLDPDAPVNPKLMVAGADYYDLFARVAAATGVWQGRA
jgi:hypothetical protein